MPAAKRLPHVLKASSNGEFGAFPLSVAPRLSRSGEQVMGGPHKGTCRHHALSGLASLWTRSGLNWTKRFPTIAVGLSHIPATELIVDGEVISANEHGAANFSQLQDDLSKSRYDRMAYYVFDLLYLDGYDLRSVALIERKRALQELLAEACNTHPVIYSEHFDTDAGSLFRQACEMKLEGIVSKFKAAPYKSERNESWIKVKCLQIARYEVIGYKNGATSLCLASGRAKTSSMSARLAPASPIR